MATIASMTPAQFKNWATSQRKDIASLAAAVQFACNCVTLDYNKQPINAILRLPRMAFKSGALRQDGVAVRDYTRDLLKSYLSYNADRNQFDFAEKRGLKQAIDWATVPSFADFILTESAKKKAEGSKASGITSKALLSAIGKIVADGFGKVNIAELDAIIAALPKLTERVNAAHAHAQTVAEGKAPSVTDGATGEYTRHEAQAPAEVKAETAEVADPRNEPAPLTAIAAAFHKGEAARKAA